MNATITQEHAAPIATPDTEHEPVVTTARLESEALQRAASVGSYVPAGVPNVAQSPPGSASREDELMRRLSEREQLDAARTRLLHAALRDREVATALVGRALVAGAASQLLKLWQDEFVVVDDAGETRVASRDGVSVNQAIGQLLLRPEYAHFCQPASRGGAAPRNPRTELSDLGVRRQAATLGESIVESWRDRQSETGLERPFGLKRRR